MVDRAIPNPATAIRQGRIKMLLILAICASPVVLGTLAYWFYRSESTTNYGSFIEPQRQAEGLEAYRGKWVLLTSDSPRCDEACAKRLYLIRQIRLTQGKDKERVERVLLLSEPGKAAFVVEGVESLEKVHEGMHQLYLEPEKRARLMGIATGELAAGTVPDKGIFLVDPLGHVMMRFPEDPDPSRMKKDLSKLLKWSRVG
ncbi:MAG: cytochrome C oxidase subunit I [Betaproteobacteria bacterium]|nr:cytochrome C oxidase subunit I [Betaproteobacteria bacterium]NBO44928.1 cytochrome C oxidase subunit I [Betaproteobacteria bacterium]NBP10225.1 cytochrome C oxidase subunit I [Betaproteobacteria bacterium]NBP61752.1 cytochrome C oxidase subunit I [Betaproteobacteria bacterium]NBQ10233.1 cytochrome C oxidase subunit I [Betaproteobacteria bacterium]